MGLANAGVGVMSLANFYLQSGEGEQATFLNQGFHHGDISGLSLAVPEAWRLD